MARIFINPKEYREVLERIERLQGADEIISEELKDTAKDIRKRAKSKLSGGEDFGGIVSASGIGYRKISGKKQKVSYAIFAGKGLKSKYYAFREWGTRDSDGRFNKMVLRDAIAILGRQAANSMSLAFKGKRRPNRPIEANPFFFNSVKEGVRGLVDRLGKRLMKKP